MKLTQFLERLLHVLVLTSLLALLILYWRKDDLPSPRHYLDLDAIPGPPLQTATDKRPFQTEVAGERYRITPRFDYALEGIVVTTHEADALGDIWHHDKWRDFLNVRDLCVIWGENLRNGVYRDLTFDSDSWTCWTYFPDRATYLRFHPNQLSNNHLLTDDPNLADAILAAEIGDRIRFTGVLAEYANLGNGFRRGTSTTRDDTGNHACETVFIDSFQILDKANPTARGLYRIAKWVFFISLLGSVVLAFITPVRRIS